MCSVNGVVDDVVTEFTHGVEGHETGEVIIVRFQWNTMQHWIRL